jgi:hypothetical protein
MNYYHLVARTRFPQAPLQDRDICAYLWTMLIDAFPTAVAGALMPSHAHVATPLKEVPRAKNALTQAIRSTSRKFGIPMSHWEETPSPAPISNREHLIRTVRYIHLNPCRDGLAKDPLEWEWSTHRDALGFCHPIWVTPERSASALGMPLRGFPAAFHRLVSSDFTTDAKGTPLPLGLPGEAWVNPETVIFAAQAALRAPSGAHLKRTLCRKIVVRAMYELGPSSIENAARSVGLTRQGFARILRMPSTPDEEAALAACLRVLADPRLLKSRR